MQADESAAGAGPVASVPMAASDPGVPAEVPDPDLLRRHEQGDTAAFERLYDRHERRCLDFVRRMLAGADDATAEDLHQEIWIAVARAASSYDPTQARFVTWLYTIARNKVMDHFRKSTGVVRLAGDLGEAAEAALDETPAPLTVDPERIAHDRQLASALVREVQALPLAQRETFVLFAHQELSLEEVAQITHVGLETAKSRLRYARQTLRTRLAPWRTGHA
jgi:RNA polymerase sigma-70 factor (ECF subfamily)